MYIPDAQPIINEPALIIKNKKILVIADTHIGIESELIEKGMNVQSQTKNMINHLLKICKKHKPREIILLGDVKHNIPSSTFHERRDVKIFLETLQEICPVHILPGNHDGNINKICPEKIKIHPSDGLIIDNIGFIHGHRWPANKIMQCDLIVMAHTHPTIMLTDRREYKTFEPCWIRTKFIKNKLKEKYPNSNTPNLLVLPAFNPLCGGIAVNREGINGPIGKITDLVNAKIFLLDGTDIGKVKNIK